MPVALRFADPTGRSPPSGSPATCRAPAASFARDDDDWVLELDLPDVLRLEYKLEVTRRDGGNEWICDPGNPKRAPGAFGEKSVLELPGYSAAGVAGGGDGVEGASTRSRSAAAGLGAHVAMRVWSPADAEPGTAAADAAGQRRPRVRRALAAHALLRGEDRRRRAAAAPRRAARARRPQPVVLGLGRLRRVLAHDIVPALRDAFGIVGAPAAMGARLGGLAMLHAQRRFPRAIGALFLQSGSFFIPRYDAHESGFGRYARIIRFVRETLRDGQYAIPVPTTITVGRAEENAHNNREMARALAAQGYDVSLEEVLDLHNYVGWRDAFDPHLTALLRRAWTR